MIGVILCGGKGMRLRPLTNTLPKPLVQIKGRPILSYLIDYLCSHGIDDIILAAGYQADQITAYVEENVIDARVRIVDSGDVDVVQRLRDVRLLIDDDFFVFYGDTLSNVNLSDLVSYHRRHSNLATVATWPLKTQFGVFELGENGVVTGFKEKPTLDRWINIGHFYFNKGVFEYMQDYATFEDFLSFVVTEKKLHGYQHHGDHITVNTLEELHHAEDRIADLAAFNIAKEVVC